MTGSDSPTNESFDRVGLDSAGAGLAGTTGGVVSLEKLIASPPGCPHVSSLAPPGENQGNPLLTHQSLAPLDPPPRRIARLERLTGDGRPSLPAALAWRVRAVRRVRP